MPQSILILGAGLIGKAITADLFQEYDVTCADRNEHALDLLNQTYGVKTLVLDANDDNRLQNAVQPYDLVIIAVPGFMGFNTLKTVISAGKNIVDISFFPENPFLLDQMAKEKNVTVIVDCGVAPGLCNMWAGYQDIQMKMQSYECLVGGLPKVREWPFEYKAVFSPADVIEEYTRPARYIENGKQIVRDALSDIELVQIDGVDTLESFNTDGLRSLAHTLSHVPDMKEKTLRYPGHAALMKVFRSIGFFEKEEISVNHSTVSPLQFASSLLFSNWKLKPNEEDFTIMRVTMKGEAANGESRIVCYTLHDTYDKKQNLTSMARTTGFTCSATARLVLKGIFNRKGICPPEYVGADSQSFKEIQASLSNRNINIKEEILTQQNIK